MKKITILIQELKSGKQKGYKATIKELNNSKIYADTIPELFDLMPDLLEVCAEKKIGLFKKKTPKKITIKNISRKLAAV